MDEYYLQNLKTQINDLIDTVEYQAKILESYRLEAMSWREDFLNEEMPKAETLEEIEKCAGVWRQFLCFDSDRLRKESAHLVLIQLLDNYGKVRF